MKIVPATPETIADAVAILRAGRLVGMPTETVYGLAADAMNPDAVNATFLAKGRPSTNPLIVHLARAEGVHQVASDFPEAARRLADAFWPGPLTLVLPRNPIISDAITAGRDSVAVRVPGHPVALALIEAFGGPVTAPSANRFTRLSPTRATDVDPTLGADLILDGGPCAVGLESTVVDVRGVPRLLRPGRIGIAVLEAVLSESVAVGPDDDAIRSPGQHPRHYAPRTPIRLVERLPSGVPGVGFDPDPERYAATLYAKLHDLDRLGLAEILVERPPTGLEWAAIWDRLSRALSSAPEA